MSSQPPVRIGARASKLSLAQSGTIQRRIAAALGVGPEDAEQVAPLVHFTTAGDRIQDRRLLEVGGKGLFTKEIEEALLDGRIDCAIHSLKDMPVEMLPGLVIAAVPVREDPRDAFLSQNAADIAALPQGARLGTASLRRQAQALHKRPDLKLVMLRGNVDTRIAKLERGEADGILLAVAGLNRLGLGHLPRSLLDPIEQPPAPGQGALAIETNARRILDAPRGWRRCDIRPTRLSPSPPNAARQLAALEGSCKTAIGAYARLDGVRLHLIVEALTPDGARRFRRLGEIDVGADGESAARSLGLKLGEAVRDEGGEALLLKD